MKNPPTVDGVIGEDEWQEAVRNLGFIGHSTRFVTYREGIFWLGCDGKKLYIAIKTELPPDGKILNRAVPDGTRDIIGAFHDDSIELVLDPKRGRKTGDRTYYHIITNARGTLFDRALDPDNKQSPIDTAWRLKNWKFKNSLRNRWWEVEIAIPLSELWGHRRGPQEHLGNPYRKELEARVGTVPVGVDSGGISPSTFNAPGELGPHRTGRTGSLTSRKLE